MRIVSGEYGGRRLKSLPGAETRPTTDKVKGAIFNMIGPYFDGGLILDLYAGSGALAIEAVSRGGASAICVDKSYQAVKIIQENIDITKEPEKFTIIKGDAKRLLQQFGKEERVFDYIFLDPPYAKEQISQHLAVINELELLAVHGLVVCELDKNNQLSDEQPGLKMKKRQHYGMTEVIIYERCEG